MRPLRLRIEGLHSYREPVEVDFEELGRYGLFGIFGPTGSGKSTLLDGMTLALFGQVDRHPGRSRRGALNPHRERIEVAFTFSLSGAGEAGTYSVRRTYRGDPSGGVQSYRASLSRVGSGPGGVDEVLVEQESRVTERVERLLGLSALDFTRAVVLPQGKFMAFLHLKGAERRSMLQRILRLEPYGDGLRRAVKARLAAAAAERDRIEGERTGLGAASPEDIAEAEEALGRARLARSSAELALDLAERRHREARDTRERQRRLTEAEADLSAHLAEEGAIGQLGRRLAADERAREALVPAERWERDSREAAEAADRAEALEAEAARLAAEEAAAREALAASGDAAGAERGRALARREALRVAVEQARRRDELAAELAALEGAAAEPEAAAEALRRARAERREALEAAADERAAVDDRYRACAVREDERDALVAAEAALDTLEALEAEATAALEALTLARSRRDRAEAQVATREARAAEARTALAVAEAALAQAEADPRRVDREELYQRGLGLKPAEEAARAAGAARAARRRAEEALEAARSAEKPLVDALRAAEARRDAAAGRARAADDRARELRGAALVAAVAAQLREGAPCPVCGSAEHPEPAAGEPPDTAGAEEAARAASAAATAAAEAAAEARARWDAHAGHLRELGERARAAERAWREARGALPEDLRGHPDPVAAMAERRAELEAAWRANEAAWAHLERARAAAEAQRIAAERARSPLETAQRQREEAERALSLARREQQELLDRVRRAAEALDAARGELDRGAIRPRLQALRDRERRARALREQLDALDRRSAALRAEADRDEARLSALAESLGADRARRASLRDQLEALEAELHRRVGGGDPAAALAELEAALRAADARREAAAAALEAARAAAAAARERARSARADADARRAAAERASGELREALDRTGFAALGEAREAAMSPGDRAAAEERVGAWLARRGELEAAATRARRALRGERVSDGDWALIEATLLAARDEADATLERRSAAESALAVLRDRAERHAAIGARLAELDRLHRRLETLKQLFAGNKFVEFIATDTLLQIARQATVHLGRLTDGRYLLSLDGDGNFLVRDQHVGGATRPVTSLSGGETFLTSLSLALALSAQVQLQGRHPIEFFFLDEGFGSLDPETLEQVMGALDSLRSGTDRRVIGVISHVDRVREWLPRYLEVRPPRDGEGSTVRLREA